MGKLLGLIGTGVGMAREAALERRARQSENTPKSSIQSGNDDPQGDQTRARSGDHERDDQYSGVVQDSKGQEECLTKGDLAQGRPIYTVEETDETDWIADDAQGRSTSPDLEGSGGTVAGVVGLFAHDHPPPSYDASQGKEGLTYPVIIPQRRPEHKGRGFIRAYAPALMDCGIDQPTFLDFLESFNAACKLSPVFDVVNIAAFAAGFAPSIAAQVASIAVTIAVIKTKSMEVDKQTNKFLDQMNEVFFKPHGLFCMIMTYRPEEKSSNIAVNMSQNIFSNLSKSLGKQPSTQTARGEFQFPQTSPLIFPAAKPQPSATEKKQSSFSNFRTFTSDYFDKRAQAKYSQANPDSPLAAPAPEFRSRLSDPKLTNMNKAGLISMATGGALGQRGGLLGQRREPTPKTSLVEGLKEAAIGGRARGQDQGQGQDGKGMIKGVIKRTLGQAVLYLMIVNLPSDEELNAAEHLQSQVQGKEY